MAKSYFGRRGCLMNNHTLPIFPNPVNQTAECGFRVICRFNFRKTTRGLCVFEHCSLPYVFDLSRYLVGPSGAAKHFLNLQEKNTTAEEKVQK
jgi:hypothetical protein